MRTARAGELLKDFSEITGTLYNPHIGDWKKRGGKVVGIVCCPVPKELIQAAGMLPFRIRGTGSQGTELSEKFTGDLCCSFPRNFFNQAQKGKLDFLDGVVFSNNCDHYRRLYDNWHAAGIRTPFLHMISNPKRIAEQARQWYENEMVALLNRLQEHFGVTVTEAELEQAIRQSNETRRLQRRLYELRKAGHPSLTGAETLAVMVASTCMPPQTYNQKLESLLSELDPAGGSHQGIRLMIVSSSLDNPVFLTLIEDLGGLIVADYSCFGAKLIGPDIEENSSSPLQALSRHYLTEAISCPRLYGSHPQRIQFIQETIREYKVEGVIGDWLTFCDTWNIFHYMLKQELKKDGIPFLMIEREYIPSFKGQLKTRVQAFLEMIRG
ncbi:MAG: 2-hydroxyacyl-CoA dehydratase family protein [bacterium]|nr:2-hydroxyacyl-CoA dehydratase family protein [bacterium]